jgi:hypothetical protein
MNANLVRASRLQPAFDDSEIAEVFQDADVRYGPLTVTRFGRAASPAVAAIANYPRFNFASPSLPAHHRQISSLNGMRPKLPPQVSLGLRCPGEDHQAAGFLV